MVTMTALQIMMLEPIPWLMLAFFASLKLMITAIETMNSLTPPQTIARN